MPFNTLESPRRLSCPLTRHLEGVAALVEDDDRASLAALVLSFMGNDYPFREAPDYRNLGQLMEMLVQQGNVGFHAELTGNCCRCPLMATCGVGRVVLKPEPGSP